MMRLGMGKSGAQDIYNHIWFKGFDWDMFKSQKMAAPYIPKVKDPEDVSNFDPPADDATHPSNQAVA